MKFHSAVPFGLEFFKTLQSMDVLLAAPLSEDTPRSALDAQASGQYVLAYDTYYYRDLQESGAAVEVVPWRNVEAMGRALVALFQDRDRLTKAIEHGVAFARQNTQEILAPKEAYLDSSGTARRDDLHLTEQQVSVTWTRFLCGSTSRLQHDFQTDGITSL